MLSTGAPHGMLSMRPFSSTEGAAGQGWRLGSPWGTAVPGRSSNLAFCGI